MAILLAINGPHKDYGDSKYTPPPFLRVTLLGVGVIHTILSATALTAVGYGIAWRRRGLRFFDQPGHWLLVELSLTAMINIVPSIGYRWMANSPQVMTGNTRIALPMILAAYELLFAVLARMAINIYLGITKCHERRWKFVFYAKALATVLFGLGAFVVAPMMIPAWRTDRREQVPRDAGHWYGVLLQLAVSGVDARNRCYDGV